MATVDEIARLRRLVNDPEHLEFSDADLSETLDRSELDFNLAASELWGIKAGSYSSLVNVTESGSTRNLSDLHAQALKMQGFYSQGSGASVTRTRIGRIVRE